MTAEGDLDFRGALGVSKDVAVGDTDASEEQMATLKRLTERWCVVAQTLRNPVALEVECARAARTWTMPTRPGGENRRDRP